MDKTEIRREILLDLLSDECEPVNGKELADRLEVSRQVIVQDIAILKNRGFDIISTNRGYSRRKEEGVKRVFEVVHGNDEIEKELNAIVDLGAVVKDVYICHSVYGKIGVDLNIKSRRDAKRLIESVKNGGSKPLNHLTQGRHYHTVIAENEEILDEAERKLKELGFLY